MLLFYKQSFNRNRLQYGPANYLLSGLVCMLEIEDSPIEDEIPLPGSQEEKELQFQNGAFYIEMFNSWFLCLLLSLFNLYKIKLWGFLKLFFGPL